VPLEKSTGTIRLQSSPHTRAVSPTENPFVLGLYMFFHWRIKKVLLQSYSKFCSTPFVILKVNKVVL
jgi:hypothetical protein